MPKPIKKRTEKKITTTEENLKETVGDIRQRLKQRQRTLIYAFTIFIALTISITGFVVYKKTSSDRAAELELEGYRLFYGDYNTQIIPSAERYKRALEIFKKSYTSRKKSDVLLYIANCYYELGNYDESIKTLKELVNQFSDPKILSLAYYKMSFAYIKKGDMSSAIDSLNNILNIKDIPLQDMALLETAKMLELSGKTEDAKNKYKELINKFPKSALLNEARARLENS
ncbi:tetratricopeptide repeat domain protein [Dissulfurispira thermophila]|uniref:Tetratricopeptide repeat domain protein n=2 Tax=root TaxID=1 RepID=A0A7G1H502_9BACT|nr:tetratricopeptide repeat protein [Dissulfurispira thermophila]BCB97319.1 tetratricopeptide repeat domain protein [Dissulfurispira thermophila]